MRAHVHLPKNPLLIIQSATLIALMGFIGVEWMTPARGAKSAHVEVPLNCKIPKLIWWFESILAMFVFSLSHLMSFRKI